jgi:hypothetical protein
MDAALSEFLRLGPTGAAIVVLAVVCYRLWQAGAAERAALAAQLKAAQDARVADTKELIGVQRECVVALTKAAAAMEASEAATKELQAAFDRIQDELRRPRR